MPYFGLDNHQVDLIQIEFIKIHLMIAQNKMRLEAQCCGLKQIQY